MASLSRYFNGGRGIVFAISVNSINYYVVLGIMIVFVVRVEME